MRKRLKRIYEAARTHLVQTYVLDDDDKSRLIIIVLQAYFAALDGDGGVDLDAITQAAINAFVA